MAEQKEVTIDIGNDGNGKDNRLCTCITVS